MIKRSASAAPALGAATLLAFSFRFSPISFAQDAAGSQDPVAAVSSGAVTQQDIADWQAAQGCYGPDALTSRKAGFMRMYEATILDEVLNLAGRPVTQEEYQKEIARIDAETRAPDILKCIKQYFGDAAHRYSRVFIRPILTQRYIREYVKASPVVQKRPYDLKTAVSSDVAKGAAFSAIGAKLGVAYASHTYSVEADTAAPSALEPWNRWSPFEAAFIEEHLNDLKPGQAKPAPIEDETSIKFVRLTSVTGKKYKFETLTIRKISTEDYLKSVPKLRARINDKELRDWAAPIKGNPLVAPAEIAE